MFFELSIYFTSPITSKIFVNLLYKKVSPIILLPSLEVAVPPL